MEPREDAVGHRRGPEAGSDHFLEHLRTRTHTHNICVSARTHTRERRPPTRRASAGCANRLERRRSRTRQVMRRWRCINATVLTHDAAGAQHRERHAQPTVVPSLYGPSRPHNLMEFPVPGAHFWDMGEHLLCLRSPSRMRKALTPLSVPEEGAGAGRRYACPRSARRPPRQPNCGDANGARCLSAPPWTGHNLLTPPSWLPFLRRPLKFTRPPRGRTQHLHAHADVANLGASVQQGVVDELVAMQASRDSTRAGEI